MAASPFCSCAARSTTWRGRTICTAVPSRRSCLALVQGHAIRAAQNRGIEQFQTKGRPMSLLGKAHLVIVWSVDSSEEGEWDRLFASHGEWMTGHPRDGDVAFCPTRCRKVRSVRIRWTLVLNPRARRCLSSTSTTNRRPASPGTGRRPWRRGRTISARWFRGVPGQRYRRCTVARLSTRSGNRGHELPLARVRVQPARRSVRERCGPWWPGRGRRPSARAWTASDDEARQLERVAHETPPLERHSPCRRSAPRPSRRADTGSGTSRRALRWHGDSRPPPHSVATCVGRRHAWTGGGTTARRRAWVSLTGVVCRRRADEVRDLPTREELSCSKSSERSSLAR